MKKAKILSFGYDSVFLECEQTPEESPRREKIESENTEWEGRGSPKTLVITLVALIIALAITGVCLVKYTGATLLVLAGCINLAIIALTLRLYADE